MSAPGVIIELDEVTVYSACVGAACNEAGSQESQLIFFLSQFFLSAPCDTSCMSPRRRVSIV